MSYYIYNNSRILIEKALNELNIEYKTKKVYSFEFNDEWKKLSTYKFNKNYEKN